MATTIFYIKIQVSWFNYDAQHYLILSLSHPHTLTHTLAGISDDKIDSCHKIHMSLLPFPKQPKSIKLNKVAEFHPALQLLSCLW